jgi:hypothetical protein
LCFSTASSRKAKEAASWNLQPLQTNLKVLQEQQTQAKHSTLSRSQLAISPHGRSFRKLTRPPDFLYEKKPSRRGGENEFVPERRFLPLSIALDTHILGEEDLFVGNRVERNSCFVVRAQFLKRKAPRRALKKDGTPQFLFPLSRGA